MSKNELLLRLKRVIRERLLLTDRNRINKRLEQNVQQLQINSEELNQTLSELKNTHEKLRSAYVDTINRLVIASEYKDEDTGDHIIRMSQYCELLAQKTDLSKKEIKNVRYASPMHDIGKIGIPDSILLKPGKLTNQEFDIIKSHTTIGGKILIQSNAKVLQTAYDIALTHHEKWNGQGYPRGLKKDQIPLVGRIVGIADVFDALTSNRPYKEAYPVEVACEIIKKERENHFDPNMVDIFLDNIDDIIAIKNSMGVIEDLSITDFQWSERDRKNGVDSSMPAPS
jgi:putative two-component system response regulator